VAQELTPGIVEQIDIAAKLTNYGMDRQVYGCF